MAVASAEPLLNALEPSRLRRRAVQLCLAVIALALIALLAPGLGRLRERLVGAELGWLVAAGVLEALSCLAYVVMFRSAFCPPLTRRRARDLAVSELGMGSLIPASGASGLALGAVVLRSEGMSGEEVARRSIGFFLVKSSVNFAAVAVVATAATFGIGGELSPVLTIVPALVSVVIMAAVLALPHIGPQRSPRVRRAARWLSSARRALSAGAGEAARLVRARDAALLAGAVGYWAFDNAVLWATFNAFGDAPSLTIVLLGYLIGQLGGLLPLPGGIGGIDGGLVATLIVYGAPPELTVAAVLAYRLILFWLPLAAGAVAFASLRRGLDSARRREAVPVPMPVRSRARAQRAVRDLT